MVMLMWSWYASHHGLHATEAHGSPTVCTNECRENGAPKQFCGSATSTADRDTMRCRMRGVCSHMVT